MTFKCLLVLSIGVLWMIVSSGHGAGSEARIALIMGASEFHDGKSRHHLPGVHKDLAAMEAKLRGLGFEVRSLLNPTLDQAQRAVEEFGGRLRAGQGVGLFYFAGGIAEFEGSEFLVPANVKVYRRSQLPDRALPVGRVLRAMEASGGVANLVFLDGVRVFPGKRVDFGPMHARGVFIGGAIATAKLAEVSFAGSLYTRELLQSIATPGLGLEDLHTLVMGDVLGRSPFQNPFQWSGLETPFYFRPAFISSGNSFQVFEPTYLQGYYRRWPDTLARLFAAPKPGTSPTSGPDDGSAGLSLDLFSKESRGSARCFAKVPRKGTYTVGGHGSPWYLSDDRSQTQDYAGRKMYPQDLAQEIRQDPRYRSGMPITLYACRTGMGSNSFAQKLADELNVEVTAPEDVLWSNAHGPVFVGPWKGNDRMKKDYARQSGFKVFHPQPESSAGFWSVLSAGSAGTPRM